jgi:CRP-like cAMP-binding protein
MSKDALEVNRRRKHVLTDKTKALSAKALAQKIGYLRIDDLPDTAIFDSLPRLSFKAGRRIRSRDNLYLVKTGEVIIRHARHDYFVKELAPGLLFGNMPLLGQTLIGTEAIAGSEGATLGVLDTNTAKRWIESNPLALLEKLGPRLSSVDAEHYRSQFQLADSRLARLILELSAEGTTLEGLTHEELGELLGTYRETVSVTLSVMELDKLIKVGRKKITILDKRALRELSEL